MKNTHPVASDTSAAADLRHSRNGPSAPSIRRGLATLATVALLVAPTAARSAPAPQIVPGGGGCCIDFTDDATGVGTTEGFAALPGNFVTVSVQSPGPSGQAGDSYLHLRDENGPSGASGPVPCPGDWSQGCYELCWDYLVINDGDSGSSIDVTPWIIITGGGFEARFFWTAFTVSEPGGSNPGWHTLCAPIAPLDGSGGLPTSSDGNWVMTVGTDADWDALLANATSIKWTGDVQGAFEEQGYDNICLTPATCPSGCMEVVEISAVCATDDSGDVIYTFEVTNNSGIDAAWLSVLDPDISTGIDIEPNNIWLDPLLNGLGGKQTFEITISGANPGLFCFDMILQDASFSACCSTPQSHCIEIPCCDCAIIETINVECTGVGDSFDFTFTFKNCSDLTIANVLLFPPGGSGITLHEDSFNVGAVLPGESQTIVTTVVGATPGTDVCIDVTVHDVNGECCAFKACTYVPVGCAWVLTGVDTGFAGPGISRLLLIGNPLKYAGAVTALLMDAPPSTPAWTFVDLLPQPFPILGGTLVPSGGTSIAGFTDAEGELALDFNITGLSGLTIFAQSIVLDPVQPQLVGFSNALQIDIY